VTVERRQRQLIVTSSCQQARLARPCHGLVAPFKARRRRRRSIYVANWLAVRF